MASAKKSISSLGNVLRLFRIARDMTVKELAEKMDVSSSYICDVERGARNPSMETYQKYSDALRVPLSTIIFFNEEVTSYGYSYRKLLISILQKVDILETEVEENV